MWFDWSHFTTSSVFLCFFVSPSDIGWDEAGDEAHKDWQETDWLQFHRWTTTTGVSRVFVMYVTHAAIKHHHHVPLVTMKLEIKKTWSALFTLSGNLMQLMQWEKVFPSALKFSLYTSIGHKKQHRREDYRIMTGWQTVTLWVTVWPISRSSQQLQCLTIPDKHCVTPWCLECLRFTGSCCFMFSVVGVVLEQTVCQLIDALFYLLWERKKYNQPKALETNK